MMGMKVTLGRKNGRSVAGNGDRRSKGPIRELSRSQRELTPSPVLLSLLQQNLSFFSLATSHSFFSVSLRLKNKAAKEGLRRRAPPGPLPPRILNPRPTPSTNDFRSCSFNASFQVLRIFAQPLFFLCPTKKEPPPSLEIQPYLM